MSWEVAADTAAGSGAVGSGCGKQRVAGAGSGCGLAGARMRVAGAGATVATLSLAAPEGNLNASGCRDKLSKADGKRDNPLSPADLDGRRIRDPT